MLEAEPFATGASPRSTQTAEGWHQRQNVPASVISRLLDRGQC